LKAVTSKKDNNPFWLLLLSFVAFLSISRHLLGLLHPPPPVFYYALFHILQLKKYKRASLIILLFSPLLFL